MTRGICQGNERPCAYNGAGLFVERTADDGGGTDGVFQCTGKRSVLMRQFIRQGNDLDNRGFFIAECIRQVVGRAASSQVRRLNRGEKR